MLSVASFETGGLASMLSMFCMTVGGNVLAEHAYIKRQYAYIMQCKYICVAVLI